MEIRTLEKTTIGEITSTFNEAFQGYFIPLVFTEESMSTKLKSEGIKLQYSVGAFEKDRLVGFILHGFDVINSMKTIYNAGTGVVADFRGRGITKALYEFAIPMLMKEGIYKHLLEVIENNLPALHVYEKMGFRRTRKLQAFKGKPLASSDDAYAIRHLPTIPEEAFAFSEMVSAWQNSLASVRRDMENHQCIGAFRENELIGFAAFVAATGRIKQLSVHPHHRRKGVGTALLSATRQRSMADQLIATNIDEAYEPGVHFLAASGFTGFLGLYEMELDVVQS
jgi:ribosomal protein S18 acetylase RimI-like enzyme